MSNCTVKVKSLRVEGVPGVLRLDSSNSLSLHVHWVGADPRPVRPSQVTQELRVPVCGNIPLIKPGRLTGCGRRKLGLDNLLCINASFLMSQKQCMAYFPVQWQIIEGLEEEEVFDQL